MRNREQTKMGGSSAVDNTLFEKWGDVNSSNGIVLDMESKIHTTCFVGLVLEMALFKIDLIMASVLEFLTKISKIH